MMIRNRLAASAQNRKALPRPVLSSYTCGMCGQLENCAIMSRLHREEGSTVNDIVKDRACDLETFPSEAFFHKWISLVNLEEAESQASRAADMAAAPSERRVFDVRVLSHRLLDNLSGFGRVAVEFSAAGFKSCDFISGDPIVIYIQSDLLHEVAIGFVSSISPTALSMTATCDREIGRCLQKARTFNNDDNQDFDHLTLRDTLFVIKKDEMSTGGVSSRSNLVRLYSPRQKALQRMLIDMEAPTFSAAVAGEDAYCDAGGEESEGALRPTEDYLSALDEDQREAVSHCLKADQYALLLGMPGTGKTTTLVALIRLLASRGKRVLVSSYTHSAVDNLLLKVEEAGTPVLRIGNVDKADARLSRCVLSTEHFDTVERIGGALREHLVIGATCLGANSQILGEVIFDYCIIDEASQVTVPIVLGPMLLARRHILVGDHFQLPPLVRSQQATQLGLDVSLFKMLAEAQPGAVATLSRQYRMNEDIQAIANATVYGGRLRCGSERVRTARLALPAADNFVCRACGTHPACWMRHVLRPEYVAAAMLARGVLIGIP